MVETKNMVNILVLRHSHRFESVLSVPKVHLCLLFHRRDQNLIEALGVGGTNCLSVE